jgi:hypothetical protein
LNGTIHLDLAEDLCRIVRGEIERRNPAPLPNRGPT